MRQLIQTILMATGFTLASALAQDTGTTVQAGTGTATIRQDGGGGNEAYVTQSDLGAGAATAPIAQSGNFNLASIDQHGGAAATAEATQQGDRNRITITQGDSDRAPVMATQAGADNVALFNQSAAAGGNGLVLQQFGNGNVGSFGAHDARATTAWARQGGDLNGVSFDQAGDSSRADVLQAGNRNRAQMTQDASRYSNAYAEQVGDDDTARVHQSHAAGSSVSLSQHNGNSNFTAVDQHDGSGLEVFSYQVGSRQAASIDQTGENAMTFTNQMGDGNTLNVRQVSSLAERSNLPGVRIDQRGAFNAASIVQAAPGGTASVQQFGDGNRAGIVQGASGINQRF